jgi:hypothetical protein
MIKLERQAMSKFHRANRTGAPVTRPGDYWHTAMVGLERKGLVEGKRFDGDDRVYWSLAEPKP